MASAWSTAAAQEPAEPAAAPASDPSFTNGVGKASAQVAKIAPGVGSLELAIGTGKAVSELRNGLAQSQAQAADLGLIGTVLTAEGCGGGDPLVPAQITDQLPKPIRVDNRKGTASFAEDVLPLQAGDAAGVGRMEVSATDEPTSAEAIATMTTAGLGPVVTINGGKATATTRIVDGNAREAVATTEMSIEIAGVLELAGMKWQAIHRTGAGAKTEGTFVMGSAPGAPAFADIDTLAPIEPALNQLLAPTGLSIQLPKVVHITEPVDLVRVTPLRIQLKDSQLGGTLLGPVLDATRDVRTQLFDAISAQLCQAAGAFLVADVATTILAGAGFLTLEIGGVEATTTDVQFEDPFGTFTPP
ncbi:MAG TPA: hypothetical protein VEA78_05635, partial [Acidimicrobiales bacterium]|nr:hypothetical protein [Acidimicrobiales bacterium]